MALAERPFEVCQGAKGEASKRCMDIVLATLLLMLTSPFIALAALLIKLTSRGPVLYRQIRLGRRGRPFTLFKLRTMLHNCEKQTGPRWCVPGDGRLTPLGRLLRATKIDELPQLWNVLRGEMSLVGPRPERPEFIANFQATIPHYHERLLVLPGLSGLAQVQLPPDTDLESVRRKLICDLCYVRGMSLGLDLRILAATPLYLLGMSSVLVRQLLALPGVESAASADMLAMTHLMPAASINPA